MKYMGIDYGTRKTGIALSDEEGKMAFPHSILLTDAVLVKGITQIIKEEEVGMIVIGKSVSYGNKENPVMEDIGKFKEELQKIVDIPIVFESEMFTSAEAKRFQGEHEKLDASAAALILQHYIDKKHSQ